MSNIYIKTTPAFERKAKKLLTVAALEELFDYLEIHPEKGDLIQGTGSVRKLRWRTGKDNKGKSGGIKSTIPLFQRYISSANRFI